MARERRPARRHLRRNPFTHAVELIRFAFYAQFNAPMLGLSLAWFAIFLGLAIWGYDPARGLTSRRA